MRPWLRTCLRSRSARCAPARCSIRRSVSTFQVGDKVIFQGDALKAKAGLSQPLQKHGKTESHQGVFKHNDIIGKQSRDEITSASGHKTRLHYPTLDQHIVLSPRLVTPIYPDVAERIVSLLDINVDCNFIEEHGRPFEILEAGTGHGSLTLHLAKAVHAANAHLRAPIPNVAAKQQSASAHETIHPEPAKDRSRARSAIIHTTDVLPEHSDHARKLVADFRRGMYAGNVDFHEGDIARFFGNQRAARGTTSPFLDAVVLDLPKAHNEITAAAAFIVRGGTLATFCPQITQILQSIQLVRRQRLPLILDRVVELNGTTAGGRLWDVRLAKPRPKKHSEAEESSELDGGNGLIAQWRKLFRRLMGSKAPQAAPDRGLEAVCHPMFGELVTAGGFVAIWKRI